MPPARRGTADPPGRAGHPQTGAISHHGREEPSRVEIDTEKAASWLAKGAQPTEAVAKLLAIAGIEGMAERKAATRALRAKVVQAKAEPAKAKTKPKAKK